jgi:hypothetical protein
MPDKDNGNIDLNAVFSDDSQVSIDESDRLKFAKQVLVWLSIICIPMPPQNARFRTTGALQFKARQ